MLGFALQALAADEKLLDFAIIAVTKFHGIKLTLWPDENRTEMVRIRKQYCLEREPKCKNSNKEMEGVLGRNGKENANVAIIVANPFWLCLANWSQLAYC